MIIHTLTCSLVHCTRLNSSLRNHCHYWITVQIMGAMLIRPQPIWPEVFLWTMHLSDDVSLGPLYPRTIRPCCWDTLGRDCIRGRPEAGHTLCGQVSGVRFLRVVGVICLSKGHIVQTPRDALSKGKCSGAPRSGTHRKKTLMVHLLPICKSSFNRLQVTACDPRMVETQSWRIPVFAWSCIGDSPHLRCAAFSVRKKMISKELPASVGGDFRLWISPQIRSQNRKFFQQLHYVRDLSPELIYKKNRKTQLVVMSL
jgi:hypothetical protein